MYNANKVKTFTPILPIGTGPTGLHLQDALYDIFNNLNEENCSHALFSDYRINEMVRDFISITGMKYWIDGEYELFLDYKIKIETMALSKLEEMHEFDGY